MLLHEKGNPSFIVSEEVLRDYYSTTWDSATNKGQDAIPTGKEYGQAFQLPSTSTNHKSTHTSIFSISGYITWVALDKQFKLLSSTEYTNFRSEILICNISKSISLIKDYYFFLSCLILLFILQTAFIVAGSRKYQKLALRTSHLSLCSIQTLQAKICRGLTSN